MKTSASAVHGALVALIACRPTPPVTVPTDGPDDAALPPPPITLDATIASVTSDGGDITIATNDPCTPITAHTADETSTTCATHDEADAMVAFITRRRSGGAPPASCYPFPPTSSPLVTICASDDEVLRAIDFLSDQRRTTLQKRLPRKR